MAKIKGLSKKGKSDETAKPKSKPKKKASGDNFFVLHGEKIAFAVILLLAVWMITKGSGLTPFTLTPDDIKSATAKAEARIKDNDIPLEEVDKDLTIYDYSAYARLIKSSLKAAPYVTTTRWEQSLFPDKVLRPDVVPLSVEGLRAVAGVGAIRYRNDRGSGSTAARGGAMTGATEDRGRHWVTVTGLIPISKELKQYDEKFGNAQFTDLTRDIPKYIFYDIVRGVEGPDGKVVWDKEPIDLSRVYENEVDQWFSIGLDPVAPDYIVPIYSLNSPSLTMDCPPIVNKMFGGEVSHLPQIPLLSDIQKEQLADMMKESKETIQETKKSMSRDFGDVRTRSIFSGLSSKEGGSGVGPAGMGPMGPMGPGMMGPGMMPGVPGMMTTTTSRTSKGGTTKESAVEYYLFRHFDFDVEEGKTYCYKVKLYLANPNFGLDTNLVEDPNTVSQVMIESEFSEPSNPVSLGNSSRILVEDIEPATRPGQEPKITIASIYFNPEDAKESVSNGKKVVRGQVANFPREQHRPVELNGTGMMRGETTTSKKDRVIVNHESDICVLDAEGGAKINGTDLQSPAKLLVMGPNGLVKLHDEANDKRELEPYLTASAGLK